VSDTENDDLRVEVKSKNGVAGLTKSATTTLRNVGSKFNTLRTNWAGTSNQQGSRLGDNSDLNTHTTPPASRLGKKGAGNNRKWVSRNKKELVNKGDDPSR